MLYSALLILLQAAGSSAASTSAPAIEAQQSEPGNGVTVIGRSLRSTQDALEQCLAAACPPREDIAASMAHAENQIVAGEIKKARKTLIKARSRNKRFAEELPQEVAGLLQLDADVASLVGLADYRRIATIDAVDALKAGLSPHDPDVSIKRLEVADVFLEQGKHETAINMYDGVAKRAEQSGWPTVQGAAMFRALRVFATAASVDSRYAYEARRRKAEMMATSAPEMKPYRDAALVMDVALRLLEDDDGANVTALMQELKDVKMSTPVLVYTPEIEINTFSAAEKGFVTPSISNGQWVDFTYIVRPDGTVTEAQIVSKSKRLAGWVIDAARETLAGRRYVPLDLPAEAEGMERRERFMIVADVTTTTGSHLRLNSGKPKLMTMDLTSKAASLN